MSTMVPQVVDEAQLTFTFEPDAWHRDERAAGRLQQSVLVQPRDNAQALRRLGHVWRVAATKRWYYTWNGGNIRKMGHKFGYETKEMAATAMLNEQLDYQKVRHERQLTAYNKVRRAAGLLALDTHEVLG